MPHSTYHTGKWGSLWGNCCCRSVEERKFLRNKRKPFWTRSLYLKSALLTVLAPRRLASCGRCSAGWTLVLFLTFLISDSSILISALSHSPPLLAHSACLSSWFFSGPPVITGIPATVVLYAASVAFMLASYSSKSSLTSPREVLIALKASKICVRNLNSYGLEHSSDAQQWLLMDVAAMVKVNMEL